MDARRQSVEGDLAEAKRLLDHFVEHAPEPCRGPMLVRVRAFREVAKAEATIA